MTEQIRGGRWTDGMAIHGTDLQRETQAWQSSLLDRFSSITDYGVVNPDQEFLVRPRGGTDPLELYISPGTCYPSTGERIYIPVLNTPGGVEGVSFWLHTPDDPEKASDPHLLNPDTGDSLLLGNTLQTNLVWVIYRPETDRTVVLENNTTTDSEWVESFSILVSPIDAPRTDIPDFFWNNIDRAVLVGVVTPTSTTKIIDADIDLGTSTVAYNRPMFSGRDDYARKKLQDYRLLLDTYPNSYIERRSSAVGNVYGDVFTEEYVYSDVYQDNLLGTVTGTPGAFYLRTTHFPKFIVSAVHSNGQDMSEALSIVSRKHFITVELTGNQISPIVQSETLTITYSYYNVAEGYLNKSSNPDSVTVAQPLENEMALIMGAIYSSFAQDTRVPTDKAQYPATYTFFMTEGAILDCKPRVVFGAIDLRRYVPEASLPVAYQVTTPSRVICYLTGFPGLNPGTNGVTFSLVGLDGNGDVITESVVVSSDPSQGSSSEVKPGLGNNNTDWRGFFKASDTVFSSLLGCTLTDNDITTGSTTGSNRDFSAFVLSAEDIDLRRDLPTCKVTINAAGDALDYTFEDLRDDYLFQSMLSMISTCRQVSIVNGTIMAFLPAGEPISAFDICYLKPGKAPQSPTTGYLYRAVASDDSYKPNVVGVAQASIATEDYGWVLLRGVVINGNWSFSPGVLYLSASEPGKFSQHYPFQYTGADQDQMRIAFSNGSLDPYLHIQIGSGHFYSPSQPGAGPTGYAFAWDTDTDVVAQNFAEVVSAWTAAGSGVSGTSLQATVEGSTVVLGALDGVQDIQVQITQVGSTDSAQLVCTQTSIRAALITGVLEGGGACTPTTGDGFILNGTPLLYGTDWTTTTDLATLINSTSGGSIAAESAGASVVNLTSLESFTTGTIQDTTLDYGYSCLAVTGQTFRDSSNLTISPELLPYKPPVRCGYAITSSKVLFDGPVFSKRYSAELFVEDFLKQYSSNQAEGCLVEIPKFIVLCRRPEIIPLAGAVPIFVDDDSEDGQNRMFVWIQGFSGNSAVINVAIKRKGSAASELRWYLTPDEHKGSITFRVLPDCAGEISGFKNMCYPDKLGEIIGGTEQHASMQLKRQTSGDVLNLEPSDLIKNPYATTAPPDESFSGEATGTYYDNPTYTDFDYQGVENGGADALEWVDAKTLQLGFFESTLGDGCRFYVSGYDRMTIIEMSIGRKQGDARVKFFSLGWERVNFFGLEGDKVRFYLAPKCSEPWIYDSVLGGSDSGVSPAANSPRACKVLGTTVVPRVCTRWE